MIVIIYNAEYNHKQNQFYILYVVCTTLLYNILMCDTVLKPESANGEKLSDFLHSAMFPSKNRRPKLTVPTIQRLLGHLLTTCEVDGETLDAMHDEQEQMPGPGLIENLVAPMFRSVEDFKASGAVVVKLFIAGLNGEWRVCTSPIADEVTGMVSVTFDDLHQVDIDPRSPGLWDLEEYYALHNRPRHGSGISHRLNDVATTAIRLSAFSQHPHVPLSYLSATFRHFEFGTF